MLKIRKRGGGGDWRYVVGQTGHEIKANSLVVLMGRIRKHLDANGFTDAVVIEDDVEEWNAYRFQAIDPQCCFESEPNPARSVSIWDIARFTRALLKNLIHGKHRVDLEEANRRARICIGCEENDLPEGCTTCMNSGRIASTLAMVDQKTDYEKELKSCRLCHCFNRIQIWFPLEELQKNAARGELEKLPSHCWKKPI